MVNPESIIAATRGVVREAQAEQVEAGEEDGDLGLSTWCTIGVYARPQIRQGHQEVA